MDNLEMGAEVLGINLVLTPRIKTLMMTKMMICRFFRHRLSKAKKLTDLIAIASSAARCAGKVLGIMRQTGYVITGPSGKINF